MAVNQLKAGAALSYVSIGLNILIGLLYTPYMLRMMGQNEYGLYSLVASVVSYLTVLDLGFGNAIIRYTAKFRAEGKVKEQYQMFGMFLALYSIIGLIAMGGGSILYFNIDQLFDATMTSDDLCKVRVMMLLMIFNLAFTFPMSIWGAIISAYENFVFIRVFNIVRIVLNPLVMIILLSIGYKAIAMVVVTTIFNVISLVINAWYCKYHLHIKILFGEFKWGFLKEVSVYSFWIFLSAIIDRVYWSTGQFVLGIFKGPAIVAVYAIAIQLEHMYMSFSGAIVGVFLPKITNMVVKGNQDKEISDLFIKSGRVQFIVMAFILTGFILFGRPFINIWAGPDYSDAYWISLLFFVPLTIPLIQNLGITVLQARNKMKFRSLVMIVISFASLAISIPLAKKFGGIGCAIGTSLALVAGQIVAMNIYYYNKMNIDIPTFWKEIIKMCIAPLIVSLISFYFLQNVSIKNFAQLTIYILIFCAIYIPCFWFMSMNHYERDLFSSPIKYLASKISSNH